MLDAKSLDTIFLKAQTHSHWQEKPVADAVLKQVYELARMAPTAANTQPMRVVFIKSAAAKEKLKPCLDAGNVEKTMKAPVTALIAYDLEFYEKMPKLFPHTDARSWYVGKPEKIQFNAFQSGTLQGAYLIIAARALGLDCGPMGGFNNAKCDEAFFKGTPWRSNFLCNLGYGEPSKLYPRNPRLDFEEACKIV